jgi:hypothetical protein
LVSGDGDAARLDAKSDPLQLCLGASQKHGNGATTAFEGCVFRLSFIRSMLRRGGKSWSGSAMTDRKGAPDEVARTIHVVRMAARLSGCADQFENG